MIGQPGPWRASRDTRGKWRVIRTTRLADCVRVEVAADNCNTFAWADAMAQRANDSA